MATVKLTHAQHDTLMIDDTQSNVISILTALEYQVERETMPVNSRQHKLLTLSKAMKAAEASYRNIRSLLIEELSTQQADVLRFVVTSGQVDSAQLGKEFSLSQQHAATLLKDLWELGLLDRRVDVLSEGRRYVYEVQG